MIQFLQLPCLCLSDMQTEMHQDDEELKTKTDPGGKTWLGKPVD